MTAIFDRICSHVFETYLIQGIAESSLSTHQLQKAETKTKYFSFSRATYFLILTSNISKNTTPLITISRYQHLNPFMKSDMLARYSNKSIPTMLSFAMGVFKHWQSKWLKQTLTWYWKFNRSTGCNIIRWRYYTLFDGCTTLFTLDSFKRHFCPI